MSLAHTREVFEEWGRQDPMHAALTRKGYGQNRWDPEAFFQRGREEVADVLEHVRVLGLRPVRRRALDFGCGVGRLTRALAGIFDEVVGVDIATAMVEAARRHSPHADRVRFRVNTRTDLRPLDTARFDFVYSSKTLQHIPPWHARSYIREFVRVLRPGGVAAFQVRNGPYVERDTLRGWLYRLRRTHGRRIWRRLRGRPPYEMHVVNRDHIVRLIRERGGRVVDIHDLSRGAPNRSLRFVVERGPHQ